MLDEKNRRILVIDDNRSIHEDFRKILAAQNDTCDLEDMEAALFGDSSKKRKVFEHYELDSACQGQEGYEKVIRARGEGWQYAVAFVDMRMPPGWDGVQTIEKIWQIDDQIQVVICTAYSDYSWQEILERFGATDRLLILKKPFDTAEVCQLACSLTQKWQLARHAHLKLNQLKGMVEEQTRQLQAEVVERRRSEEALKASETRYALAAMGASDGLFDWNLENDSVYFSDHWKEMIGYRPGELAGNPSCWLDRVNPADRENLDRAIRTHLSGETQNLCAEYRIRHRDGHERWMVCRGLAARDENGRAVRIAGWQSDITDRKLAEQQLRHDALHDMLTGIGNRTLLVDRLDRCFEAAKRHSDEHFAVLFLDLDKFKSINDTYGHLVGDQLLIAVANRISACVRSADTAARFGGGNPQLARLGGDEFVILLERIRETADAERVAERLQEVFQASFKVGDHEISAGTSIGIAISAPRHRRPEDILREADVALYQSKAQGKGRFELYDESMEGITPARWDSEQELRRAIEQDQFAIAFQPIVSLHSDDVIVVEALARWTHPIKGEIRAAEFIPLAEETGLIIPLGNWVFEGACRMLAKWQAQSPRFAKVCVSINISTRQLLHPTLVDEFRLIMEETGVDPGLIRLELRENTILEGTPQSLDALEKLRNLKVKIHLDNFGTGYSPLAYLRRVPIEAFKVDRSFVNTLNHDAVSASIVQATVALAHSLGVQVIAEGVETEEELQTLKALGCDAVQGFHVSYPMNGEELIRALLARKECLSGV